MMPADWAIIGLVIAPIILIGFIVWQAAKGDGDE